MSFVSSKGNILCRLKIELYKIFAIINRAIKSLHCNSLLWLKISSTCAIVVLRNGRKIQNRINDFYNSVGPSDTIL